MSKKSVYSSKRPNRGKPDDEVKRPPSDQPVVNAWRPLGPKTLPEEDLVSILQGEMAGRQELDDLDAHFQPGPSAQGGASGQDSYPDAPPPAHETLADLAELAATVFDTTFYLVPRVNTHYLLGELAERLRVWMPELCALYGWELSGLAIRPDYLQWTLVDFPEILTSKALLAVRRWTSAWIFRDFSDMQAGEQSQDFWAPGYLVDTQERDFPTQVLISHISRKRSG
ncbi:MAG: transposase [Brevefilum sp.]